MTRAVSAGGLVFAAASEASPDDAFVELGERVTRRLDAQVSELTQVLTDAGSEWSAVVKVTCWVANLEVATVVREVLPAVLGRPGVAVAVIVAGLPTGALLAVDVVASAHPGAPGAPWFTSAMAIDVATMRRLAAAGSIEQETRLVLQQLSERLAAAGSSLTDVAQLTCYLSDVDSDRAQFDAALAALLDEVGHRPILRTVGVGLAGNCRVQLEAVAGAA